MSTRRGFLAQCIGGLGVAFAGAGAVKASGGTAEPEVQDAGQQEQPLLELPPSPLILTDDKFYVRTHLNPNLTVINVPGGKLMVDEMFIQFGPAAPAVGKPARAWVGVSGLIIPGRKDEGYLKLGWKPTNRNGDSFPCLEDPDGNEVQGVQVAAVSKDYNDSITRIFCACPSGLVDFTRPLSEEWAFNCCDYCRCYETVYPSPHPRWIKKHDAACHQCGNPKRMGLRFGQGLAPFKLYMCPSHTMLVCADLGAGDEAPPLPVWPEGFHLSDRMRWIEKEAVRKPMAVFHPQYEPVVSDEVEIRLEV